MLQCFVMDITQKNKCNTLAMCYKFTLFNACQILVEGSDQVIGVVDEWVCNKQILAEMFNVLELDISLADNGNGFHRETPVYLIDHDINVILAIET